MRSQLGICVERSDDLDDHQTDPTPNIGGTLVHSANSMVRLYSLIIDLTPSPSILRRHPWHRWHGRRRDQMSPVGLV